MQNSPVTNEALYELLKEFKADMQSFKNDVNRRFDEVDRRFDEVDKRFEQVDKRFEQIDRQLSEIRGEIREDKRKLEQVYEARDTVKIKFGLQWGMVSLFIATISAIMANYFHRWVRGCLCGASSFHLTNIPKTPSFEGVLGVVV